MGRLVRDLVEAVVPSGTHFVLWDGKNQTGQYVPTGVYFYQLKSGSKVNIKKLIHLR